MRKLIGAITLTFLFTAGICSATVETWDPGTGTITVGPGGNAEE